MKRAVIFVALLGAGILFVFSGNADAQKKVVEYRELYDLRSKAEKTLYTSPMRVESIDETLENGSVVKSEYELYEYLDDDRTRDVSRKTEGGKTIEHESITIGHFRYDRINKGPWTKVDLRTATGSGTGSGMGSGSGSCSVRQLTVESVFVGNFPARLFEEIEVTNGKDGLVIDEDRVWIGENGDLLQKESVKGTFSPRNVTSRSTVKYDYDPNIKIEAPIP